MNKMKNIGTFLLIVLSILISSQLSFAVEPIKKGSPQERVIAWANAQAHLRGDIPGVDYQRFEKTEGNTSFTLKVGNLTFNGGIITASIDKLSRDEINNILNQILKGSEFNLTAQELANAQFMVNQAEDMADWGMADVERAINQATGLDTILESARQLTGNGTMSKAEYAASLLGFAADKANPADSQLGLVLTSKTNPGITEKGWERLSKRQSLFSKGVGKFLTGLMDISQVAGEALAKHLDKNDAMEEALQRKLKVEAFYALADEMISAELIRKYGRKDGEKYMILKNATATVSNVTFWGISGLTAKWKADMELTRTTQRDGPQGVRGAYRGELTLKLVEISGFDKAFSKDTTAMNIISSMIAPGHVRITDYKITANSPTQFIYTASAFVTTDVTAEYAPLQGAFEEGENKFSLDMNLTGSGANVLGLMTWGSMDASFALESDNMNSFSINKEECVTVITGPAGTQVYDYFDEWPGTTVLRDIGNILEPLKSSKSLKVKIK